MKSAARFIDANTTCSLSKPSFNLAAKEKKPAYAAVHYPVSSSPGARNDSRWLGLRIPISPWFTMNSIHLRQQVHLILRIRTARVETESTP
jgi:hypothetical protein